MNILYLCYWGLSEGLTQATVFPHLKLLAASDKVEQIIFVTIERNGAGGNPAEIPGHPKVVYRPLVSRNFPVNLLNKINDFVIFPGALKSLIREFDIKKVIARGSPAGALVYKICKEKQIPYYVESFEPHADYMLESDVWRKSDPRYLFQKKWEEKIKSTAAGLMPVAENYKAQLVTEGVCSSRIVTVPCSVDLQRFAFDDGQRQRIREKLQVAPGALVSIYVGKFGGIYYDEEAFELFRRLMKIVPSLVIIILTPDNHAALFDKIEKFGLPKERFRILTATHQEVPYYLSAADFALATIKPAPSRKFCSAIKVGEYWANGLPVLITTGVGDDSDIIGRQQIGAVLPLDWQDRDDRYLETVVGKLRMRNGRQAIAEVARRYRSLERCVEAYKHFGLL
ncbi:hypothetical protein V9K67_20090 [Paraflavisolibacter sp. H34]|uniref:hypothetical protein n=1 Tax=Huijunlia imazamoxiresistens TaxID=3127457 RepID=UPI003016FED4